jgi:hypothetical protein
MSDGTFKKVEKTKDRLYGPKAVLICGYDPAEHEPLTQALGQIGFGDRPLIFVTDADSDKTLEEVLACEDRSGMGEPSGLPRATVMSGFTQEEVHLMMHAYRRAGLPAQLWATLTPISENWTVRALLDELLAESEAFKKKNE